MEETNFVLLWKEHYEKIDQTLAINKRLLSEMLTEKAGSSLRAIVRGKVFGIVVGVVYLAILGAVLFVAFSHYSHAADYFIVSISAIFLINVKALYDYVRHLILVAGIPYDKSIREIQSKLGQLQVSLLRHTRIMVLQFPFWTTFFLSSTWFPGSTGAGYIVLQVAVTGSFVWLAVWLYRKQTLDNLDNRWVRLFISGVGGRKLVEAMRFYAELDQLESTGRY